MPVGLAASKVGQGPGATLPARRPYSRFPADWGCNLRPKFAKRYVQQSSQWRRRVPAIDYEAEYNNRARVPEHPEIFARWTLEAELYRAEMLKNDRAELGLTYGSTPRQTIDLFLAAEADNAPLAIFIHGGWWRSLDPSMFSHMARGPNGQGISVAVVGYDLCP